MIFLATLTQLHNRKNVIFPNILHALFLFPVRPFEGCPDKKVKKRIPLWSAHCIVKLLLSHAEQILSTIRTKVVRSIVLLTRFVISNFRVSAT